MDEIISHLLSRDSSFMAVLYASTLTAVFNGAKSEIGIWTGKSPRICFWNWVVIGWTCSGSALLPFRPRASETRKTKVCLLAHLASSIRERAITAASSYGGDLSFVFVAATLDNLHIIHNEWEYDDIDGWSILQFSGGGEEIRLSLMWSWMSAFLWEISGGSYCLNPPPDRLCIDCSSPVHYDCWLLTCHRHDARILHDFPTGCSCIACESHALRKASARFSLASKRDEMELLSASIAWSLYREKSSQGPARPAQEGDE